MSGWTIPFSKSDKKKKAKPKSGAHNTPDNVQPRGAAKKAMDALKERERKIRDI